MLKFAVVGLSATVADLLVYVSLAYFLGLSVVLSKGAGFITGTVLGFLLNRNWTFGSNQRPAAKFIQYLSLYTASLFINVSINAGVISLLGNDLIAKALAFIAATLTTASLNFMVLQGVIFAKRK